MNCVFPGFNLRRFEDNQAPITLIRGASVVAALSFSGVGPVRLSLAPVCGRRLRYSSRVGFMPFILFNSRQRRRVLVISFKQSSPDAPRTFRQAFSRNPLLLFLTF